MKIEIDPSDLEWGTYYRDEKCKELEGILRGDSRFAECEVKRIHCGDESTDPFQVFDENGEGIVELERWEVYTLSDAELFTYIEVQRKQILFTNSIEAVLLGMSMGALVVGVANSIIGVFFQPDPSSSAWFMVQNQGWFYLLALLLGIFCVLKYRDTKQRKKNVDLEAARDDPLFRGVLQKLADLPETESFSRKKYLKRLEYIENASAGIN